MNKKQRSMLLRLGAVIVITAAMVIAMVNIKEVVNKKEAMLAAKNLNIEILKYKQANNKWPLQSYVDEKAEQVYGRARLGNFEYRGGLLGYVGSDDTVVFYIKRDYSGMFLDSGYIAAKVSGEVEWLSEQEFDSLMSFQWTVEELKKMKEKK